jgi:hypothetical protein
MAHLRARKARNLDHFPPAQKKHGPQAVQHEAKMKAAWSSG